jgi:ketosteroid isomerase-like protein
MPKLCRPLWTPAALGLLVLVAAQSPAAEPITTAAAAEAEVLQAVRDYDQALKKVDVSAVERFWASEYTFINARGERLTRDDRVANLRTGRTSLDTLTHVPEEDRIKVYGDIAVYTTLLKLSGHYSGEAKQGQFQALVVWIRRDGRWQQLASQMTPVAAPSAN